MQIKYCSITGADDAVQISDLSALATEFPFLETAILLLPARAGSARFPRLEWIEEFGATYNGKNAAMHLCDDGFLGFVDGRQDIRDVMKGFQRIQLNLKFGDVEGKYDPTELAARVREAPQWQFILQYTDDKNDLLPLFTDIPNHAVLFDESAGRGISPDRWSAPLPGHFCGYAGGMNPDNVATHLGLIQKAAEGHLTWIDMESGIRTDDQFDLTKVRRVLEIAAPYAA